MIYKWQIKSRATSHWTRQQELPQIEFKENLRGVLKLTAPVVHSPCLEVVEELSEDAREIVQLLVETPAELLNGVTTPHRLLARVRAFLMRQRGYSRTRLRRAQEEVQEAFRELWRRPQYSPVTLTDYAERLIRREPGEPCLTDYAYQLVARADNRSYEV